MTETQTNRILNNNELILILVQFMLKELKVINVTLSKATTKTERAEMETMKAVIEDSLELV
jgi:hypothetical protein